MGQIKNNFEHQASVTRSPGRSKHYVRTAQLKKKKKKPNKHNINIKINSFHT